MTATVMEHPAAMTVERARELARTTKGHKNIRRVFTDKRYPGAVFVVTKSCLIGGKSINQSAQTAHAHDGPKSSSYGLVCVRPEGAKDQALLAHEYAHLVNADRDAHGKHWRAIVTALGYPEEAERYARVYSRPKRKACTLWLLNDRGRIIEDSRRVVLIPLDQYEGLTHDGRVVTPTEELIVDLWEANLLPWNEHNVHMMLGRRP